MHFAANGSESFARQSGNEMLPFTLGSSHSERDSKSRPGLLRPGDDLSPKQQLLTGPKYILTGYESYETAEQLKQAITDTIEGIPKAQLIAVFRAWRRKLEQCIENNENYFE
jgi:hypothetical protein